MTDWRDQAACKGHDTNLWFPERNPPGEILLICESCPVKVDCLEYAMDNGIKHGFWGGMSERQRGSVRRGRPVRTRAVIAQCGTDSGYQLHKRRGERIDDACLEAHNLANQLRAERRQAERAAELALSDAQILARRVAARQVDPLRLAIVDQVLRKGTR